jgi:hypothetical protein
LTCRLTSRRSRRCRCGCRPRRESAVAQLFSLGSFGLSMKYLRILLLGSLLTACRSSSNKQSWTSEGQIGTLTFTPSSSSIQTNGSWTFRWRVNSGTNVLVFSGTWKVKGKILTTTLTNIPPRSLYLGPPPSKPSFNIATLIITNHLLVNPIMRLPIFYSDSYDILRLTPIILFINLALILSH